MNSSSIGWFSKLLRHIPLEQSDTASIGEKISLKCSELWKATCCKLILVSKVFHHTVPGVVYREKVDTPLAINFLDQENEGRHLLLKLPNFEVCSKLPFESPSLHPSQIRKAQELLAQDLPAQDLLAIGNLLSKSMRKGSARNDFSPEDWQALDKINFDLTQVHFEDLLKLFNSTALNGVERLLQQNYGVDYKEALIAEALAKSIAPIPRLDGKAICLPVKDSQGFYRLSNFSIRHTPLGDNLPCYIFESDDPEAHPWMAIRGTESIMGKTRDGKEIRPGSIESLLADSLDAEGLAQDVITKAIVVRPVVKIGSQWVQRESLLDLFEHWRRMDKKVNVTGHSLGGYLTDEMTLRFYEQVRRGYAFSPTGVSSKQEAAWKEKISMEMLQTGKNEEELNRKLVNFDIEGDIIPTAGRKLIGLHLAITSEYGTKVVDPFHAHLGHNLNKNFHIQKIDIEKENSKILRRITEGVRANVGRIKRLSMEMFNSKELPDWWRNRKIYREALCIVNANLGKRWAISTQ